MKYKLIVDLPNLKAGNIFEINVLGTHYVCQSASVIFTKEQVETQPQFFENIIDDGIFNTFKEFFYNYLQNNSKFTIEEFKHPYNGNVYKRNYNGTYGFNLHMPFDICAARYLINKISCGKDNLPLRIGTKCKLVTGQEVTIESFLLVNNIPKIMTKNSSHFLTEISHIWQEEKTPKQEYITLPNKVKIPITKGLQVTFNF